MVYKYNALKLRYTNCPRAFVHTHTQRDIYIFNIVLYTRIYSLERLIDRSLIDFDTGIYSNLTRQGAISSQGE